MATMFEVCKFNLSVRRWPEKACESYAHEVSERMKKGKHHLQQGSYHHVKAKNLMGRST